MLDLPVSPHLPVSYLSGAFNRTTNSYKFYWFLAILEDIRTHQTPVIPIDRLLAAMVASVWYPTNYFCLTFGKQDRLSQIALQLKDTAGLTIDAHKDKVAEAARFHLDNKTELASKIASIGRFVPQRFIRPFFSQELRGKKDAQIDRLITQLATAQFNEIPCLYRFVESSEASIEMQPDWFAYLREHYQILVDFCCWNLLAYLQSRNPNVPNIGGKLFPPGQRDLSQAREFWDAAFEELNPIICIYSGQVIQPDNFSLDHFLPWRFVTHDLLWNIVPTLKAVNSAKNDNLPDLDKYLTPFTKLQYDAFQSVAISQPETILEDYTLLFSASDVKDLTAMPPETFQSKLQDTITSQVQIAKNMGFTTQWSYQFASE